MFVVNSNNEKIFEGMKIFYKLFNNSNVHLGTVIHADKLNNKVVVVDESTDIKITVDAKHIYTSYVN